MAEKAEAKVRAVACSGCMKPVAHGWLARYSEVAHQSKLRSVLLTTLQVREQERRAEEQRRAKQAADEEWRRAQHERELQRKAAEEALEREAKVGGWQSGLLETVRAIVRWDRECRRACPGQSAHACMRRRHVGGLLRCPLPLQSTPALCSSKMRSGTSASRSS